MYRQSMIMTSNKDRAAHGCYNDSADSKHNNNLQNFTLPGEFAGPVALYKVLSERHRKNPLLLRRNLVKVNRKTGRKISNTQCSLNIRVDLPLLYYTTSGGKSRRFSNAFRKFNFSDESYDCQQFSFFLIQKIEVHNCTYKIIDTFHQLTNASDDRVKSFTHDFLLPKPDLAQFAIIVVSNCKRELERATIALHVQCVNKLLTQISKDPRPLARENIIFQFTSFLAIVDLLFFKPSIARNDVKEDEAISFYKSYMTPLRSFSTDSQVNEIFLSNRLYCKVEGNIPSDDEILLSCKIAAGITLTSSIHLPPSLSTNTSSVQAINSREGRYECADDANVMPSTILKGDKISSPDGIFHSKLIESGARKSLSTGKTSVSPICSRNDRLATDSEDSVGQNYDEIDSDALFSDHAFKPNYYLSKVDNPLNGGKKSQHRSSTYDKLIDLTNVTTSSLSGVICADQRHKPNRNLANISKSSEKVLPCNLYYHYKIANKVDVVQLQPLNDCHVYHETRNTISCPFCDFMKCSKPISFNETKNIHTLETNSALRELIVHLHCFHSHFKYDYGMEEKRGNIHILVTRISSAELNDCIKPPKPRCSIPEVIHYQRTTRMSVTIQKLTLNEDNFSSSSTKKDHPSIDKVDALNGLKGFSAFYHSMTGQPVRADEVKYDSDEEALHEREMKNQNEILEEYSDLSVSEKSFMTLWNSHIATFPPYGDRLLPLVFDRFITKMGHVIAEKNMRYCFLMHIINFYDFGLLLKEELEAFLNKLDKIAATVSKDNAKEIPLTKSTPVVSPKKRRKT